MASTRYLTEIALVFTNRMVWSETPCDARAEQAWRFGRVSTCYVGSNESQSKSKGRAREAIQISPERAGVIVVGGSVVFEGSSAISQGRDDDIPLQCPPLATDLLFPQPPQMVDQPYILLLSSIAIVPSRS